MCTEKVGLRNKAVGCSDREVSVLNDSLHFFFYAAPASHMLPEGTSSYKGSMKAL